MQDAPEYEYQNIEPYLIPETRKLAEEIFATSGFEVKLIKAKNPTDGWQVNKENYNVIDMPGWDEGNRVNYTHELLHIYFYYCKGMRLTDWDVLILPIPYNSYFNDQWYLANYFLTLSNHLQHHKMIPYFKEYQFPIDQIIGNYYQPENVFEAFENDMNLKHDFSQPVHRYMAALCYVNFLCLEYYFPNPDVRTKILEKFSDRMDAKFEGMRTIFHPLLSKWDSEYSDLRELIFTINSEAKTYAEAK